MILIQGITGKEIHGEQDGTEGPGTCRILYMGRSNPYNIHFCTTAMGTHTHSYMREEGRA